MTAAEAYNLFDLLLDKTGSASMEDAEKREFLIEATDELINSERSRLGADLATSEKLRPLISLVSSAGAAGVDAFTSFVVHNFPANVKFILSGRVPDTTTSLSVKGMQEVYSLEDQAFNNYLYVGDKVVYKETLGLNIHFVILLNPTFNWSSGNFVNLDEQGQRDVVKKAVRLAALATEDPRYQAYDKEEQE